MAYKSVDQRVPTLLQRDNIAHIKENKLLIGDRRSFIQKLSFVSCSTWDEIATSIKEMVTQGGGPLQVALTSIRLASQRIYLNEEPNTLSTFMEIAEVLSSARPTNTTMKRTLQNIVVKLSPWYRCSEIRELYNGDLVTYVDEIIDSIEKQFDKDYEKMGEIGASFIEEGDGILTTCFAEHSFILSLLNAQEEGKNFKVYVPETRPYLQGSRLTAPSLAEVGIDVKVVTDGMGATLLQEGKVDLYMTASDLVTMEGVVVNKTGTLGNAIACSYYKKPYYVFAMSPDTTAKEIVIEEREGSEITTCLGQKTTPEAIGGYYPAFDIIDSSLVKAIITPKGALSPSEIKHYYQGGVQ